METWKDIEGYEGLYQVSNFGRVKSLARKDRFGRHVSERIMKAGEQTGGYYMVQLCSNGKHKAMLIHRLVASAFIPKPDGMDEINHIDENPANNRADNLEWCNHAYNINYGTRKAKVAAIQGKPVIAYREDGEELRFCSISEAARQLSASSGSICSALKGRYSQAYGYQWRYAE